MRLTDEQVRRFDEDGFLIVDRLIDDDTVAELRTAYDAILAKDVEAAGDSMLGGITRQVMMACFAHPVFNANPALDVAVEMSQQLFGTEMTRLFDMLIYKPPGHPHPTPWHQDMAYAGQPVSRPGIPIPLSTVQFWIALDDVDEENGCMHFLPGYHTKPLMEHRVASGDPDDRARLLALVDPESQVDLARAVAAPLRPGGCTLHSYGTPHYTPPNRSLDRPRRAYIFNLVTKEVLEERLSRH
ncbi:MAG TPA: phytanoyl-CoA dioxygenase family protein [Acidimicrobiales bacterium]